MTTVSLENIAGFAQRMQARGHTMTSDEPRSSGGSDTGPAPYEILLASLLSCTSLTLRMVAQRKGWPLGAIHVDGRFTRDSEGIETIARTVELHGALSEEQIQRLLDVCEKTPVTKSLKRSMVILTTLRRPACAP